MLPGDPYPDYLNPILIKELRQGLRSRSYVGILLGAQGVAAFFNFICAVAQQNIRASEQSGILAAGIFLIFVVALPLTSLNSVGGEMTRDTFPLVRLTAMDGLKVLFGKWCARVAETILLFISLIPHLILRFFLGGAEIGGDLAFFAVCLLASVVFSAVAIACSVQRNWFLRIALLAGIIAGVCLSNSYVFTVQALGLSGNSLGGFITFSPAFLAGPGALLVAVPVNLVCIGVLLFWAAERLALSPVTFQPQLRVVGLAGCLLIPASLAADWYFQGMSGINGPPVVFFLTSPLAAVSLLILLHGFWSEPPPLLSSPTGWKRLWFFRPGWPGGVWFASLILFVLYSVFALSVILFSRSNSPSYRAINEMIYCALGIIIITMGSFLLWRLFHRKAPWPAWLWLVIWLVAGTAILAWSTMNRPNGFDHGALALRFLGSSIFGIGFVDVLDNGGIAPELMRLIAAFWAFWAGLLTYSALRKGACAIRLADSNHLAKEASGPSL